jgi:hypothetical protein
VIVLLHVWFCMGGAGVRYPCCDVVVSHYIGLEIVLCIVS